MGVAPGDASVYDNSMARPRGPAESVRSTVVSVRLSPEEARVVERAALRRGLRIAAWVRAVAVAVARKVVG